MKDLTEIDEFYLITGVINAPVAPSPHYELLADLGYMEVRPATHPTRLYPTAIGVERATHAAEQLWRETGSQAHWDLLQGVMGYGSH